MSCNTVTNRPAAIPSPLVIAYASWGQCDDSLKQAAEHGANVIIWFSINLECIDGVPRITGPIPDPECIASIVKSIREAGLSVLHMVAIGGWNAPLPDVSHSAAAWFEVFTTWNEKEIARPHLDWHGFDGIDWDLEGHDDPKQARNHVISGHLTLVGDFSILAKRAGYILSMAPAQSYLDVENSSFDLSFTHAPEWRPDFPYHGRNLYAFWLAFYNETKLRDNTLVPTFDWVSLQLYEGWSRTNDALTRRNLTFPNYFQTIVSKMAEGWPVDFGQHGGVHRVKVPAHQLVIGFANGWTRPYPPPHKFLLVMPEHIQEAWKCVRIAGFMFWTVREEGNVVNGQKLFIAKELANIVAKR